MAGLSVKKRCGLVIRASARVVVQSTFHYFCEKTFKKIKEKLQNES